MPIIVNMGTIPGKRECMNISPINVKAISGRIKDSLGPHKIELKDPKGSLGRFKIAYEFFDGGPRMVFAIRTGQMGITQMDVDRVIRSGGLL